VNGGTPPAVEIEKKLWGQNPKSPFVVDLPKKSITNNIRPFYSIGYKEWCTKRKYETLKRPY